MRPYCSSHHYREQREAAGNAFCFHLPGTDEGMIPVIVTDVPISLDALYFSPMELTGGLRAVAMINPGQNGDIAYLTTKERHRKRGFGKACVYAAVAYFARQGKKDLKIFSKPDTIDFWETQCGFNTDEPSGEDSGSGLDSATEEHEGAAAAAAGSSTKSAKCMKTPATRLTCVTMEGKVDDVLEKLKGKTMAGYAYILNPQNDWIMPVDIPGRVEIPGRVVLKRPASAAAAAADSASGSVRPTKQPKKH
jgi:predicted GNAT family acetyltransferase